MKWESKKAELICTGGWGVNDKKRFGSERLPRYLSDKDIMLKH